MTAMTIPARTIATMSAWVQNQNGDTHPRVGG